MQKQAYNKLKEYSDRVNNLRARILLTKQSNQSMHLPVALDGLSIRNIMEHMKTSGLASTLPIGLAALQSYKNFKQIKDVNKEKEASLSLFKLAVLQKKADLSAITHLFPSIADAAHHIPTIAASAGDAIHHAAGVVGNSVHSAVSGVGHWLSSQVPTPGEVTGKLPMMAAVHAGANYGIKKLRASSNIFKGIARIGVDHGFNGKVLHPVVMNAGSQLFGPEFKADYEAAHGMAKDMMSQGVTSDAYNNLHVAKNKLKATGLSPEHIVNMAATAKISKPDRVLGMSGDTAKGHAYKILGVDKNKTQASPPIGEIMAALTDTKPKTKSYADAAAEALYVHPDIRKSQGGSKGLVNTAIDKIVQDKVQPQVVNLIDKAHTAQKGYNYIKDNIKSVDDVETHVKKMRPALTAAKADINEDKLHFADMSDLPIVGNVTHAISEKLKGTPKSLANHIADKFTVNSDPSKRNMFSRITSSKPVQTAASLATIPATFAIPVVGEQVATNSIRLGLSKLPWGKKVVQNNVQRGYEGKKHGPIRNFLNNYGVSPVAYGEMEELGHKMKQKGFTWDETHKFINP